MNALNTTYAASYSRLLPLALLAALALCATGAHAAAPGITGTTFNLTAQAAYISQPDGQSVYSWGYGCRTAPTGFAPSTACQSL